MSRLVIFNETFASVREDNDFVVLWHEGIAGRKATDVASAYVKCVNTCGKNHVIMGADNCTAQNKNWYLFSLLCWCVNQPWGPLTIVVKYLERGHTYMRADSVHGSIGRRLNRCSEVRNFDEFVEISDKSAKAIKPICLLPSDNYKYSKMHRTRSSKAVVLPKLGEISVAKFEKGSRELIYKLTFAGEEKKVQFLKKTTDLTKSIPVLEGPRGINTVKKSGLIKLIKSFPASKQKFWHDLVVNDENPDLVTVRE